MFFLQCSGKYPPANLEKCCWKKVRRAVFIILKKKRLLSVPYADGFCATCVMLNLMKSTFALHAWKKAEQNVK
jgi:hypothetical protein